MPNPPEKDESLPAPALQESSPAETQERRSRLRHDFVVNAEAEELATAIRLPARVSDLSVSGCYLDTLNPFSSGARIWIHFKKGNETLQLLGVVVYSHKDMGMGAEFTDVTPGAQEIIHKWLTQMDSGRPFQASANSEQDQVPGASGDRGGTEKIERLVRILVKKGVLTQEEAKTALG
jgi:hypothetical protein